MNLLRTRLTRNGDGISIELGGSTLMLPQQLLARRPRLGEYVASEVIVGELMFVEVIATGSTEL